VPPREHEQTTCRGGPQEIVLSYSSERIQYFEVHINLSRDGVLNKKASAMRRLEGGT
jgi:hypothetical protein